MVKWRVWDGRELKEVAEHYVSWALGDELSQVDHHTCSMCLKKITEVKKMIAGLNGAICNE